MIDIDPGTFETELYDGSLRTRLERDLEAGFRQLNASGEAIPLPSYFASRIASIIHNALPVPPDENTAWELYHEVLAACEDARAAVLGEPN